MSIAFHYFDGPLTKIYEMTDNWIFKDYTPTYEDRLIPKIICHLDDTECPYLFQLLTCDDEYIDSVYNYSANEAVKILILKNPGAFGQDAIFKVIEKKKEILKSVSNKCIILPINTHGTGNIDNPGACIYGLDTMTGLFLKDALAELCIPFFTVEGLFADKKFQGTCRVCSHNYESMECEFVVDGPDVVHEIRSIWGDGVKFSFSEV